MVSTSSPTTVLPGAGSGQGRRSPRRGALVTARRRRERLRSRRSRRGVFRHWAATPEGGLAAGMPAPPLSPALTAADRPILGAIDDDAEPALEYAAQAARRTGCPPHLL